MSQLIRILLLGAVCLLAGCSLFRPEPVVAEKLVLLPPAEGPAPVLLKQTVAMQARGESMQFLVISRFDRQQAKLVALMATGQQLMALAYDGRQLKQTLNVPVELPGEEILAMIQFALWPDAALNQHYPSDKGWAVGIEANRRQLWHHGALQLDIVYDGETTRVRNYPGQYQVTIQTLEKRNFAQ